MSYQMINVFGHYGVSRAQHTQIETKHDNLCVNRIQTTRWNWICSSEMMNTFNCGRRESSGFFFLFACLFCVSFFLVASRVCRPLYGRATAALAAAPYLISFETVVGAPVNCTFPDNIWTAFVGRVARTHSAELHDSVRMRGLYTKIARISLLRFEHTHSQTPKSHQFVSHNTNYPFWCSNMIAVQTHSEITVEEWAAEKSGAQASK